MKKGLNHGSEAVYQFLKDKLIRLELKPGQLLSEQEISTRFNFGRTPIRNAFSKMERDGLVEIIPRKGALIKFLSTKDIIEIFQIRKSLESTVARLAVDNFDRQKLQQFEEFYLGSGKTVMQNVPEISDMGIQFHGFLIDSAGNERIRKILDGLQIQLAISRGFFLKQNQDHPSRAIRSIEEHLGIIEALKKGDGDLAEARMKEHLINAEKYIFSVE
jgi:DNA-binding GntR family transcriptional regulator